MKRRYVLLGAMLGGGLALRRVLSHHLPVDLRGKVVLITGASSGIGAAIAHAFAAQGAQVILAARRAEKLLDVAGELDAYGVRALVIPADITREADRVALVNAALREFGRIDVLVNNAGLLLAGYFWQQAPDQMQALVQTNLYAPIRLTQLVLPCMLERREGHIVNVSSVGGRVSLPPGAAVYVASRAGLIAFSETLRREVLPRGVRVSWVLPTWTRTPMVADFDEAYLRSFGLYFDDPAVPAAAVVDAVRHNRREIVFGGPLVRLGVLAHHLVPGLIDRAIERVVTPQLQDKIIGKVLRPSHEAVKRIANQ